MQTPAEITVIEENKSGRSSGFVIDDPLNAVYFYYPEKIIIIRNVPGDIKLHTIHKSYNLKRREVKSNDGEEKKD